MEKECIKCDKSYSSEEYNYCPICGKELEEIKGERLLRNLEKQYRNTDGLWQVMSRHGSTIDIYEGHIDEIALSLADQYSVLTFARCDIKHPSPSKSFNNSVEICLGKHYEVVGHFSSSKSKMATMKELFKDRNVEIKDSDYGSFTIVKKDDDE